MDPELKKVLDELKAEVGKHVDVAARIDKIEATVGTSAEEVKTARAEIETLRATVAERDQALKDLREQGRQQAMQRDPIARRDEARAMLGMIVRQEIARANRTELPSQFREETELVRAWHNQVLARTTVTPMDTTGSYMVPTVTDRGIQSAVEEISPFLGMTDFVPGLPSGGTFNFTFLSTRPVMQKKRSSSDTAMTASDPVFAQLQLSPAETYIYFPVDNKLFLMAAPALGGYFEGLCNEGMVDKLAYWALLGDATDEYNSVRGALKEDTSDYIVTLPNGKTAFADVTNSDLNKAKANTYRRGRGPRARWVMSLDIQGVIEDLDRTGKVPVLREQPDGTYRCKGAPVVIEEHMPGTDDSAVATGFALYGDMATTMVGMVGGIQIASDSSVRFDKNQTAFRATTIVDIKRKPVKTMTLLKTSAE
jgi:HK97 family phage major capsid protein